MNKIAQKRMRKQKLICNHLISLHNSKFFATTRVSYKPNPALKLKEIGS